MKIAEINTFVVANPPPHRGGPYFVFVKLTTDNRIEGIGEVYGTPFHPAKVTQLIEDIGERYVIGWDPFKTETLWRLVYSSGYTQNPDLTLMGVLSGIEMACWDIVGKALDQPVYNLLGGQVHEKLRSYTYLYPAFDEVDETEGALAIADVFGDPDLAPKRAAQYVEQGFTAIKYDPVMPMSAFDPRQLSLAALDNAELVTKNLREAVGSRCDLLVGTHGQMTTSSAIRLAKRLEPYDPLLVGGTGAAGEFGGDGASCALDQHSGSHRRTSRYQIRIRRPAGETGGGHNSTGAGTGGRHPGSQEDCRHGGSALRTDRPTPVLRSGGGGGEYSTGHLQSEFPDSGEHRNPRRLPRGTPQGADSMGGGLHHPTQQTGSRRRVG